MITSIDKPFTALVKGFIYLLLLHPFSWDSFDLVVPSETFFHVSTHLFPSTVCTFLFNLFLISLKDKLEVLWSIFA